MPKANQRQVQGILLLDKPLNMTSNAALQKAKRLFNARKAGHTGTLDPIATGMLVVCFGQATKFSQYLLDADKQYMARMTLGVCTTTGDSEGEPTHSVPVHGVTQAHIDKILASFRGKIEQTPPMYSAIKHQGQPLYKLARQGKTVERASRVVTIHTLTVEAMHSETEIDLFIQCSKGTYIRTLIEDIGKALGFGAHVSALRRLSVGPYPADGLVSFETLASALEADDASANAADHYLLPIDTVVSHFKKLTVSEAGLFYLKRGKAMDLPYAPSEGWLRLYSQSGAFLGIAEVQKDGKVAPRRILTA